MNDATAQFLDAIRATGLEPPSVIEPGKLHRFPGIGKRHSNTAGWCKLFEDGQGGCFGDWSSGLTENWQSKMGQPMSPSERSAFLIHVNKTREEAEAERSSKYKAAAEKAIAIWNAAQPAFSDHPYLKRKCIRK